MRFSCFTLSVVVGLVTFCASVNAFEPVSIDQFFQKYPDERPVQPTIPVNNKKTPPALVPKKENILTNRHTQNPDLGATKTGATDTDVVMDITANTYPQVEILLIDRILGHSQHITVTVGEKKPLNSVFDVTVSECLERKNQFHNITQLAVMRVDGYANSKKDTQKTILYNDVFYIQMPGFKGFEHPIYDIKPIKCLGNPQPITLKEETLIEKPSDSTIQTPPSIEEQENQKPQDNPQTTLQKDTQSPDMVADIINKNDNIPQEATKEIKNPVADNDVPADDAMPVSIETPLAVPFVVE